MLPFQNEILAGITTVGRSENLQDKNESRASSMNFSGNKSEISLKELKIKNINGIIFRHININSLRNKFEQLREFCKDNLDILLMIETKLDISFLPSVQFHIPGYCSPCRLDRNSHGGGLLLYIREDIPSKLLVICFEERVEAIFVQINLRKGKWLLGCSYEPHKSKIENNLNKIKVSLDSFSSKYKIFLPMGDFL